MHELAAMIWDRKGTASFEDLARSSGGAIEAKTLQKWANTRDTSLRSLPAPETLVGIARAVGVSVDLVAVAALRSAGVPVRDRFGQAGGTLDGLADILTDRQRAALAAVAEAMAYPHGQPVDEPAGTTGGMVASVEAGRLIEAARKAERIPVRDTALDAKVSIKDWKRVVAGEQAADADTWMDMSYSVRADIPTVFDALGLTIPGQTEELPYTEGHDAAG